MVLLERIELRSIAANARFSADFRLVAMRLMYHLDGPPGKPFSPCDMDAKGLSCCPIRAGRRTWGRGRNPRLLGLRRPFASARYPRKCNEAGH